MGKQIRRSKYITRIENVEELDAREKEELVPVAEKFAFRTNDYYQSLIDWSNPDDPIRRIVMPSTREFSEFGEWDASGEASYTVTHGLEHKYKDTGLLLVNDVCGAYCRFCFRKRLFTQDNDEVTRDIGAALAYIRKHPEINNVLLTGGDPLVMSTRRLELIIKQLREIDHIKIIRIGTKMPAFDPSRISGDPGLLEMISKYITTDKKIYIMAHFNHPRELTAEALEGMKLLQRAGAATLNQSPLIRGVNDEAEVISELLERLSFNGIVPYYLFLCRPTAGNEPYVVPIEESLEIVERAKIGLSGLARQARLCMSHRSGKIEVVGTTDSEIVFRFHRAADPRDLGRVMMFPRDPKASWFDDYGQVREATASREAAASSSSSLRQHSHPDGRPASRPSVS